MKTSNILLLIGAGLLYYYFKNKKANDQIIQQTIYNQNTALGLPPQQNIINPTYSVKVGNINKTLTPHTI